MPILTQHRIYRKDLRANPDVLYLFGDNVERRGYGGQAAEMRGEPNAVGIPTKNRPDMAVSSFFSDQSFEFNVRIMDLALEPVREHLSRGGVVILPSDGLGTGLSEMEARCPHTFTELVVMLGALMDLGPALSPRTHHARR